MKMAKKLSPRAAFWIAGSLMALVAWGTSSMAYDSAYAQTDAGKVELKNLPEQVAVEASGAGDYFGRNNDLFRRLFRYIDGNQIAMTVPVEAEIDSASMRFFVGPSQQSRMPRQWDGVARRTLPARTVVSAGVRGGYNRQNFLEGAARAESWLKQNPGWVRAGDPYAVYWNGPFVPGFLKRSEVHIPVRPAAAR